MEARFDLAESHRSNVVRTHRRPEVERLRENDAVWRERVDSFRRNDAIETYLPRNAAETCQQSDDDEAEILRKCVVVREKLLANEDPALVPKSRRLVRRRPLLNNASENIRWNPAHACRLDPPIATPEIRRTSLIEPPMHPWIVLHNSRLVVKFKMPAALTLLINHESLAQDPRNRARSAGYRLPRNGALAKSLQISMFRPTVASTRASRLIGKTNQEHRPSPHRPRN